MTPEARILLGLALVGAGGAGLLAMNLWTVPLLRPTGGITAASERVASVVVPASSPASAPASPPSAPPASAFAADAGVPVDAAADVSDAADAAREQQDASTSRSTDGTLFPPVVFEAQSKTPSREMLTGVEAMGSYLRHNFGMKVMLVGHGDAGMTAAEYLAMGRQRSATVLRMLVDYGVSVSRIGIEMPRVEGEQVVAPGIPPGTVEVRIEPRFTTPKEKESNVP